MQRPNRISCRNDEKRKSLPAMLARGMASGAVLALKALERGGFGRDE
jgi:hypothetical protein